ncbi:hypothetical protein KKC08_02660 [Patescibacteria group bacterium]|nr:hypothetical protein [Patescibacteria group bacterium]MCG2702566.1 hypothetical protein [Candidatus Parcubacteria bacterium]MBU4210258.1 hypothetical protein [Patescibacteria group bacterium]MBU4265084.1 hypothetical protein [Patescibacteria group bacterium]MBU4389676.1 hypothetical protein [Patescibacteria group bacterium]
MKTKTNKLSNQSNERLLDQMNEYLLEHPQVLKKLPPQPLIIPIDTVNSNLYQRSWKLGKKMLKTGSKNMVMAVLLNKDNWSFQTVI